MTERDEADALGRKAMLKWLANSLDYDFATAPTALWHYTDAGGLRGIVTSDRLWASNTRYLNDSTEIHYGVQRAMEALRAYDRAGCEPATRRFMDGLGDPDKAVVRAFLDRTLDVFVVCFCSSADVLSQWRAYAGEGSAGGYAIGFEPAGALQAWPQMASGRHELALRRVVYDTDRQDAVLHDLVARMVPILDADPTNVARQNAFAKHLVNGLVEAATWCKHPSFQEEQEWRIVYVRTTDGSPLPLEHRLVRGLIVPYVSLDLREAVGQHSSFLAIRSVSCGPSTEPELKRRGVHSLISTLPHLASVDVTGSTAPLRL